jgi:hypothetical protein
MISTELPIDWEELFEYLPGTLVELKDQPGILHQIECYEVTMVPPIWLTDDPHPRYSHELCIVSHQATQVCALEAQPSFLALAAQ